MTIPTFQFSTCILNLLPPIETLKLVQAKLQRRQVLWRYFEFVNWLACNSSWPWFCSREWQLQNRRIAWKWSLRGWWILPGAQDYFKYLFLLFQLFPNCCCKCLWVRLPEEVTATQDADEKPQGADHFLKHTLLISSDIYWSYIASMHYWYIT